MCKCSVPQCPQCPTRTWSIGGDVNVEPTSRALPPSSRSSSSPSSFARSMTSGGAPWKSAQGVSRTMASGRERSDHPPAFGVSGVPMTSHPASRIPWTSRTPIGLTGQETIKIHSERKQEWSADQTRIQIRTRARARTRGGFRTCTRATHGEPGLRGSRIELRGTGRVSRWRAGSSPVRTGPC
jgi:hypothetical protein